MMNKVHWLLIWLCGVWQPHCEDILISGWWSQCFVISLSCSPGCLTNIRDRQEVQALPGLPGLKIKFYPDLCVA